MKLKSKGFLIFQVAITIVTFIVMFLYQIIFPPSFVRPEDIFKDAALLSIYPTVIFPICTAIAWKIWKGKSWYSLSLVLFGITVAINLLICFLSGYPIDIDLIFMLYLFSTDLFYCGPATLLLFIIAGIIGRLCLAMNNRVHLL
ncbi:MAG: hypothetical protein HDR89_04615 [Bacteroides sp.]|nr:hypothetical protein [Bacteroides sp.]